MLEILDPTKNPVTYAIPFFVLSILVELAALKWLDDEPKEAALDRRGYERRDARTSMLMGAGSLVSMSVLKVGTFFAYLWVYEHVAPFHLPADTWWAWVLALLVLDFFYYWSHRFVHRARVGWAAHQAHHSSQYMNFSTALRQKWNPWFEALFFLPLPLLGVHPALLWAAWGINLVYQFFVHTETVQRLPRPIELVFNTPSHHRVHHGSDPDYLDTNYGGILIVWDRLFGSFQPEVRQPTYGLTKNKDTYDLIALEFGEYAELWRDVRRARTWRDRLNYLFRPPGWSPADDLVR